MKSLLKVFYSKPPVTQPQTSPHAKEFVPYSTIKKCQMPIVISVPVQIQTPAPTTTLGPTVVNSACFCRREKGFTEGWCGVAGGGVPACDH